MTETARSGWHPALAVAVGTSSRSAVSAHHGHSRMLKLLRSSGFAACSSHTRCRGPVTPSTRLPSWCSCSNSPARVEVWLARSCSQALPVLLLGPVAGLAADRVPRRTLMVGADLLRCRLRRRLGGLGRHGVRGRVRIVRRRRGVQPGGGVTAPPVVGDDDVVDANSAMWTAAVTVQIALAPVAGLIIVAFGVEIAFLINASTFIVSALLLLGLQAGRAAAATTERWLERSPRWGAHREGKSAPDSPGDRSGPCVNVRWRHQRPPRRAADRWLGVGPGGFGTLLAAIGVGAAAGPLLLRRFIIAGDKRWLFGPFLVVRGGVDLTLAAAANPVVAGGALAVYGMSTSTGMVAYQTTLQTLVPAETRGRAFAFYDVLWNAARLLSLALGGVLVDIIDVRFVYVISAGLLLVAGDRRADDGFLEPTAVKTSGIESDRHDATARAMRRQRHREPLMNRLRHTKATIALAGSGQRAVPRVSNSPCRLARRTGVVRRSVARSPRQVIQKELVRVAQKRGGAECRRDV